MDPGVLAELKAFEAADDFANPRYTELLFEHHYRHHVLRMPPAEWPDAVQLAFAHLNTDVYIPMQGPSELGASGKLKFWDRSADLGQIRVPTLTIGATHDTMDPQHCPNGSHLSQFDDSGAYFQGLIGFLKEVNAADD